MVFSKWTAKYRPLVQSIASGGAATLVVMLADRLGAFSSFVQTPASLTPASLLSILAMLTATVGTAWVFSVVESLFWRIMVLALTLAQLPLTNSLALRFDWNFSMRSVLAGLVLSAVIPELLRYRARRATLEWDSVLLPIETTDSNAFPSAKSSPSSAPSHQAAAQPIVSSDALKGHPRVEAEPLPPQRMDGTILFCELVNNAALADNLPPEVCSSFLNRLLSLYQETTDAYGGMADRNEVAGFRAIFSMPFGVEEHPESALHAALAIRGRVQMLSQECAIKFGHELDVRMGVSTGEFLVTYFGLPGNQRPGIAGEVSEWAERLAMANMRYGSRILISARTGLLGGHSVERRPIDLFQRYESPRAPEDVFEVLSLQHTLDSQTLARMRLYREGVQLFRARKWAAARQSLMAARPIDRSDEAIELLLMRINEQEVNSLFAQT